MAKKDNRYIITHSNYTVKQPHKKLKNGDVIYERDYMGLTNLGGWDSGSIPNVVGNFKFVNTSSRNTTKNYNSGNWLKNADGSTEWTLDNIGNTQPKDESEIKVKRSKKTLLDYAYYGSCVELIKVSLKNIIKNFPAELYVTEEKVGYTNSSGTTSYLGEDWVDNPVRIDNPFNIDLITESVDGTITQSPDYNPLRYFCESYGHYQIVTEDGDVSCVKQWNYKDRGDDTRCYKDGDLIGVCVLNGGNEENPFVIKAFSFLGGVELICDGDSFSGYRIHLTDKAIAEEENKLNEFEKYLLNRDSKPIYTITIETPIETSRGTLITLQNYTFPTRFGWNLDIESAEYQRYVKNILDVAEYHDNHSTDNIWRMMTHEAIKNMDDTFINPSKDEDITDYLEGIGQVRGLTLCYGRIFDDLKSDIDCVKSINNVSFDENNNIPDYFLSDSVELSGWEVSNPVKNLDENAITDELYSGLSKKYDITDCSMFFLRNLKLMSRDIFLRKGTKAGIEMVMAMFGLCSYDYGRNYYNCLPENKKIRQNGSSIKWEKLTEEQQSYFYDYKLNEYVAVAKNTSDDVIGEEEDTIVEEANMEIRPNSYPEEYEVLRGLPVKLVYFTEKIVEDENGATIENEVTKKYLIPWFDKRETYDGETYFQMYGGWMKDENNDDAYSETLRYLNVVDNISTLSTLLYSEVREGEIYYVRNIEDYKNYFPTVDNSVKPSHYFYLKNREKSYQYGDYVNDTDGWQIIPEGYVAGGQGHGIEVRYLENIIDVFKGNNPHVGYGNYDDGAEYLNRLEKVFKPAYEEGLFEGSKYICPTGELDEEVANAGFTIERNVVDNMKCWFFTNNNKERALLTLTQEDVEVMDDEGEEYEINGDYVESGLQQQVYVGNLSMTRGDTFFETDLNAFNLETQEEISNDEAASFSIINTKNLSIEFNKFKYEGNQGFLEYVNDVILEYVKQVIPSTTIGVNKYFKPTESTVCLNFAKITGLS